MAAFAEDIPHALYVHVPWCVRKCPYCDFNSHALKGFMPERAYIEALLADLDAEAEPGGRGALQSVFIGGGTPSLLSPDAVARLIEGINARAPLEPDCEITLEANPGTVESGRFAAFRRAGVNRLSIGVQSFDDGLLEAIGRVHDGRKARFAVETALAADFDNVNLDLMYGLPGQSVTQAVADIDIALDFGPAHLSHYQLTLEPNTLFFRRPPELPDDEAVWEMATRTMERLDSRGYRRYEISAFARPGFECRHNLNYWRFGDYTGIGAGAHGKLTDSRNGRILRSLKQRHPRAYLEAAASRRFDLKREAIKREDLLLEFMMNALRLTGGFELALFPARTGLSLENLDAALADAGDRGLVAIEKGRLRPTALGLRFLNELLLLFAPASAEARSPDSPCEPAAERLVFL